MNNLWLKVKIWTKVVLFALLLIYVIVFVAQNSAKEAQPWLWVHSEPKTTLLKLALYAFLAGVISTILVSTTFKTLRQVRDLRLRSRTDRLEREVTEMRTKAGMLRPKSSLDAPVPDVETDDLA